MSADKLICWFEAAQQGDVSFINKHLDTFAGSFDCNGKTALMYLASIPISPPDDLVAMEGTLLDGAGFSALCYACRACNTEGIEKLWCVEGQTLGLTPVMYAVISGEDLDQSTFTAYLQKKDLCGMTALMYAVILDRRAYIDQLLDAEHGLVNSQGRTALMLAVLCKNSYAFSKLYADPMEHKKLSVGKWSALGYAIVNGSPEFVRALLPYEHALLGAAYTLATLSKRTNNDEVSKLTEDDGVQFLVSQRYHTKSEEIGICTICLDELCIVRSYPCGHRCTCYSCSKELQKRQINSHCPLCRAEVQHWEIDRSLLKDIP